MARKTWKDDRKATRQSFSKPAQPHRFALDSTRLFGLLPRLRFWLLVVLVFAVPIAIYLPNTEYGHTKSALLYGGVSLLVFLWAVELWWHPQTEIRLTRLAWPALGLLGAAALSLINAQNLPLSLISFVGLIYFGLLGLLIVNSVESESDIKILLGALLLSASIASVYGLLQYYGKLPGPPGFVGGSPAMISTFGNPNYLAGFLAHLFVPAMVLSFMTQNRWVRLALLGVLMLMTAALVATNSVGAWLAALLATVFFLVGVLIFRLGAVLRAQRAWALAIMFLLVLTIWLQAPPGPLNALVGRAATLEPSGPIEKITQFFQRLWEENSGIARSWNWWIAYEMLKAHPFVGVGLGDYKVEFLEYKARFKETPLGQQYNFYLPRAIQAHNDYVQLIAELGLIGLLAVGFFFGVLIKDAHNFVRSSGSPQRRFWGVALGAGIVAFLADALVSFPLHLPASELNLVLLISVLYTRPLLGSAPTVTLGSKAKLAVGATALALAVTVSFFAYRDWQADIYLDAGEAEINSLRYETARIALERSVALAVAPGKALYYLGVIYAERGELMRARAYFERSLQSFPTENAYIQLAELDLRLEETERAAERLQTLLRLDPEPTMRLEAEFMRRVLVLLSQGDRTLVWAELGKFLQEHPDYPRGYLVRGMLHSERGEKELARAEFEKGLSVIEKLKAGIVKRLEQIQRSRRLVDPDELTQLRSRAAGLVQMEAQLQELIAKTQPR